MSSSNLEELFSYYVRIAGLPTPEREIRPIHGRQWRVDFAWPSHRIALEIEGGSWNGGRHTRGAGFEQDCEKYNAIALDGWTLIRVTGAMIRDGRALKTTEQAIAMAQEIKSQSLECE